VHHLSRMRTQGFLENLGPVTSREKKVGRDRGYTGYYASDPVKEHAWNELQSIHRKPPPSHRPTFDEVLN
jgi:hypothetical protein